MASTRLVLVRHGETDWSRVGRHTGRTDLSLSAAGEAEAALVSGALSEWEFESVFASPLQRAVRTAEFAGFAPELDDNLMEWDYGEVEGLTNEAYVRTHPGWSKWIDGPPGGEQAFDVGARADRFLTRIGDDAGAVVAFAHGHFLAILIARWLGLAASEGLRFPLATGSVSVVASKRGDRVLSQLNHECRSEVSND